MKKIILLVAGCSLAILGAVPVLAAEPSGPYLSGHLGVAMPSNAMITDSAAPGDFLDVEYDPGMALDLALGYTFGPARLEGEIAYQKNDFKDMTGPAGSLRTLGIPFSGDTTTTSFLLNGYYDFHNDSALTPYLAAGLGFARVTTDFTFPGLNIERSGSDTVFAYQIGAGLEYAVSQKVSLDVRYRYFATSDPSFDTTDLEFASHNVLLGIRAKF